MNGDGFRVDERGQLTQPAWARFLLVGCMVLVAVSVFGLGLIQVAAESSIAAVGVVVLVLALTISRRFDGDEQ